MKSRPHDFNAYEHQLRTIRGEFREQLEEILLLSLAAHIISLRVYIIYCNDGSRCASVRGRCLSFFFGAGTIIKIFLSFTSIPYVTFFRPQPTTVSRNTMGFNCTPAMGVEQRGMRLSGTVIEKSTVKNCFYSPFILFFLFFCAPDRRLRGNRHYFL